MMMTAEPRVFVGTMYCCEGDFADCFKSISQQKGVTITHCVIINLLEKDAHNNLWRSWRYAKAENDLFVKVDADTVLAHDEVLLEFWKMTRANGRITGIQAPLFDYFTDGYINGLNCFTPAVTFRDSADELFCDRQVDEGHDIVVKAAGVAAGLRPAGYHCYRSTPQQAFHFGVHRALKNQTVIIDQVKQAYDKHRDNTRAWALLGAKRCHLFKAGGFNYSDKKFQECFDETNRNFDTLKNEL